MYPTTCSARMASQFERWANVSFGTQHFTSRTIKGDAQFTAMGIQGFRCMGSRIKNNRIMSRLSNKVAIVTGASKGIGGGVATGLSSGGARAAGNYSARRERAERIARTVIENGGGATAGGADVSQAATGARLFQEVESAVG